jgi:hypothetical protein
MTTEQKAISNKEKFEAGKQFRLWPDGPFYKLQSERDGAEYVFKLSSGIWCFAAYIDAVTKTALYIIIPGDDPKAIPFHSMIFDD